MGPLSSWTDQPKVREEPVLFSEEVARGEKDLETELRERSDESRPYQYCPFCWKPVDRREADTFFEATIWTRDIQTRAQSLGEYTGQAAHLLCIKGVVERRRLASQAPDTSTSLDESVQHVRDEIPGQLVLLDLDMAERDAAFRDAIENDKRSLRMLGIRVPTDPGVLT
jgi:hypothetical protein